MEIKNLGNIYGFTGGSSAGIVYDKNGLCPNMNAMEGVSMNGKKIDIASTILSGYHRSNMTGFNADNGVMETVKIKQATEQGYIECKIGGIADLSYPNSKTRRGRVQDGGDVSPGLTVSGIEGLAKIETPYRIRKLTPLECWRLMGFTDEEYYKAEQVNSNTQLYKQAGNSIVVDVLVGIFKNIIESMEVEDMNLVKTSFEYETDKMIDIAKLKEKEPELFDELAADYPCEKGKYIFDVKVG